MLEKQAGLWNARLEEAKRKEEKAKAVIAADVEDLERTLEREGLEKLINYFYYFFFSNKRIQKGARQFLRTLYRKWPPKDGQTLGDLSDRNLDGTLKKALVAYHHDKQDALLYGVVWISMCTQICSMINNARASLSK